MNDMNNVNKINSIKENLLNDIPKATDTDKACQSRKIPPLDQWQPDRTSLFDIKIMDNGDWYHEGVKMTRQSLVDLFASVLWAEMVDGEKIHYLKTPTDKYQICVVDTPLFINRVEQVSDGGMVWVEFGTTNGDTIRLDGTKPLYFAKFAEQERLYIDTRFGLTARFLNNAMYHLLDLGKLVQTDNQVLLQIQSGGKTHSVAQLIDEA